MTATRSRARNTSRSTNEVQGKEHIQEYFAVLEARPGWEEKLNGAGVDVVCVEPGAALADRLAEGGRWREAFRDDFAVIFVRRGP
jgi:hypothetical protein